MDEFKQAINKNPFREYNVPIFTKEKAEIRQLNPKELLWGAEVRANKPSRYLTGWLMLEDPLMIMGGDAYRTTQVRDRGFELQQEAGTSILLKGQRKLPKTKIAEAFGSLNPNEEQTKVLATVIYLMKNIQTVCFNEEKKCVWTVPNDLRLWSSKKKTLWLDSKYEKFLDFSSTTPISLGLWLDERERDGWTIEWPISDILFEEMKGKMATEFPEVIVKGEDGKKPKKDDYAKALGRSETIRYLASLS